MKQLLLIMLIMMVVASMSGCSAGVSEEEYQEVCAERDEMQMNLERMEAGIEQASAYIEVLVASTSMTGEPTVSEITELTSSMVATGDKELVTKGMAMGQMFAGNTDGQISDELNNTMLNWFRYIAEKIGDILAETSS